MILAIPLQNWLQEVRNQIEKLEKRKDKLDQPIQLFIKQGATEAKSRGKNRKPNDNQVISILVNINIAIKEQL